MTARPAKAAVQEGRGPTPHRLDDQIKDLGALTPIIHNPYTSVVHTLS